MRFVFALLILIHGLIHFMGFAKAFKLLSINQLSQGISKPMGMFWLFGFMLLFIAALLFLFNNQWWFVFAFFGVVISQVLIILYWKDAKFGTLANLIILLVALSAYGTNKFENMVDKESYTILKNLSFDKQIIRNHDIDHLPSIIQKWMQISGTIGSEKIASVRLKQVGNMRTKQDSKWMSFTAKQYFNTESSSFIWTANVDMMPLIHLLGRDKLYQGKGEILIKLSALIPVVNEADNIKINTGSMIRYLAETCWFPSAALDKNITWESINATTCKAKLTIDNQSVLGLFKFNIHGDFISFEADRYYGTGEDAQLEKWLVTAIDYKEFGGIKIPNKCQVTWMLQEGDFNWLNLEVVAIEYNISKMY